MRVKNSVTTEDGADFIVVPEMRNGLIVWREVRA